MKRMRLLILYFYVFGMVNILTSFVIPLFFGDELLWTPRSLPTDLMISSLYMAMGIVMIAIAKSPINHKAFIDFIIISNLLHASVMVLFAQKPIQIYLDGGYIGIMGVIPLLLYPWPLGRFLRYDN